MIFDHWLHFIAAFVIVVGILSIGVGLWEWRQWRKGGGLP